MRAVGLRAVFGFALRGFAVFVRFLGFARSARRTELAAVRRAALRGDEGRNWPVWGSRFGWLMSHGVSCAVQVGNSIVSRVLIANTFSSAKHIWVPAKLPSPRSKSLTGWWDLWQIAHAQAGYFTAQDAEICRISAPLLSQNVAAGVLEREERGIYRFATFPPHVQSPMVVRWLWTGKEGVFSHESALLLHDLSDALPNVLVLTVPTSWATRRRKTPPGIELHIADLRDDEVKWIDAVPVTTPLRTVLDCTRAGASPELVDAAVHQAFARGMFSRKRYKSALREAGTPVARRSRR